MSEKYLEMNREILNLSIACFNSILSDLYEGPRVVLERYEMLNSLYEKVKEAVSEKSESGIIGVQLKDVFDAYKDDINPNLANLKESCRRIEAGENYNMGHTPGYTPITIAGYIATVEGTLKAIENEIQRVEMLAGVK